MDFLAFTQRFVTKQTESDSESEESGAELRSFGFSNESSGSKIKSQRNPKKIRKDGKDSATHSFNVV